MPGAGRVCANMTIALATLNKAAAAEMKSFIKECERSAKTNKEWTDRTGAATTGLLGEITENTSTRIVATLAHRAEHGIYLEMRQDFMGKYMILQDSISRNISGLISRLRAIYRGRGVRFPGISYGGGYKWK